MSQEERSAFVSLAVNLATSLYVIAKLRTLASAGAFDAVDGLSVWAKTVLWAIPIAIGGTIILTILFAIVQGIVTRGQDTATGSDERDRLYQRRGMVATLIVASIGIVGAFIALALGHSAIFGFTCVYFALAAGSLAGDVTRIGSYRVWS